MVKSVWLAAYAVLAVDCRAYSVYRAAASTRLLHSSSNLLLEYSKLNIFDYHFHFRSSSLGKSFLRKACRPHTDCRLAWAKVTSVHYKIFVPVALKYLCIPWSSAASSGRAFSVVGLTTSRLCSSLTPESVDIHARHR